MVLRIARVFGECEIDMPSDFEAEINRYIEKWRTSGRLKQAIQTAQQNGYAATVSRAYDGDLQMVDSSSIGSVRGRGGNSERVTV